MNQIVEVIFKKDKSKSPFSTYSKFKSQDVNSVEFHLAFDGVELDESYKVTVHCKFKKSDSVLTEVADVAEGKAIFKFDTRYITQKEEVHCSVYVSKGDQSIDVRTFVFEVELSEIDKGSLRVAEVYDANYQKLLGDFKTGGQMAISQFEISANNKTSSKLSEIGTKGNQAIEDFNATADESLDVKLGEIQSVADGAVEQFIRDGDAEIGNFNQRGDAEIVDWREHADSELEEVLAGRVVLKNLFPIKRFTTTGYGTTTGVRLDFEIGNKYYTSRELVIVKGADNGVTGRVTDLNSPHFLTNSTEYSKVITYLPTSGDGKNRPITVYGTTYKDEFRESEVLFDNLTLIDLTATFGAGNEPTKSEMDELIKITGYIDGTLTLSLKQVAIWQLNLIRQNRTALIALGGTL